MVAQSGMACCCYCGHHHRCHCCMNHHSPHGFHLCTYIKYAAECNVNRLLSRGPEITETINITNYTAEAAAADLPSIIVATATTTETITTTVTVTHDYSEQDWL